ncbi:MAG: VirB4 family type IV secretion system protein, partial [Myxococcota bacterium]
FVPSLGDDEAQLLYHTRQGTLRKVSFGQEKPNKNVLVLGGSGSGKSFHVASVFEQACLAEGGPVLVIDVQGPEVSNYRVLCDVLGGSYVSLAGTHDIAFNPFFAHDELLVQESGAQKKSIDEEKVGYLKQLVCVMAVPGIHDHPHKALCYDIARTAILSAYAATKGEGRAPLLRDVVRQLEAFKATQPEYAPLARDMYLQLQTWTKDPVRARLLDRPSSFKYDAPFQVFDFFGLEKDKDLASVLLLSVSFYVWSCIQRYPREMTKFVLFDETWKLLTHPVAAEIVAELYRTGRKWGASTWAITQDLSDFENSPIHGALLANAATIFLNQHVAAHDRVAHLVGLNTRQTSLFKGLRFKGGVYSELLMVDRAQSEAAVLQLRPTPFDLWLNSTNPADVGFRARLQKERGLSIVDALRACAEEFPRG